MEGNKELPITVHNGKPGFINLLDALNGYQLVRELDQALGLPAATSFKHVSPAGAAVAVPLSEAERKMYFIRKSEQLTPLATAFVRARGADRMSSFGDFISLSRTCDEETARCINREVSDGVIAPGYSPEALEILKAKRNGSYLVLQIDETYVPDPIEIRSVYGIMFEQERDACRLDKSILGNIITKNKVLGEDAERDLLVALVSLKYTQSNSVCLAYHGQTIGVGAGQQSRIHCTRLAAEKAEHWLLRISDNCLALPFCKGLSRNQKDNLVEQYLADEKETDYFSEGIWQQYFTKKPEVFTSEKKKAWIAKAKGISLGSDAFFPFRDNIDRAYRTGVSYIAQPGGSTRDDQVIEACNEHGITMAFDGVRLFHH
jgi:phosphoribosylaminoimidazolecarboxamide formyltransferase/IMP cyclohydrolase